MFNQYVNDYHIEIYDITRISSQRFNIVSIMQQRQKQTKKTEELVMGKLTSCQ